MENQPNIYFKKSLNELNDNEIENAIQKIPFYYITKDFQIEPLQYRRHKVNNSIFYYYIDITKRIQGELYGYYLNGNIAINSHYVDNIINGKVSIYFNNGGLKNTSYYSNGLIHGESYSYSIYGNLLLYEQYKNSKLDGICKRYCLNGCCYIQLTYENDLIKHIDQYIENKLIKSFDLNKDEAEKFDLINKKNNKVLYYEKRNGNILEIKCNKKKYLHPILTNQNLSIYEPNKEDNNKIKKRKKM